MSYRHTGIIHLASDIERILNDECVVVAITPVITVLVLEVGIAHSEICIILTVVWQTFVFVVVEFHSLCHGLVWFILHICELVGFFLGIECSSIVKTCVCRIEWCSGLVEYTDGIIMVGATNLTYIPCIISIAVISKRITSTMVVFVEQEVECIVVV